MLVLHLLGEFESDVHDRHAELLLVVFIIVFIIDDQKTERVHLARIIRVRLKVEESRTFAVIEESFALDLARVARDGEMNVLTSRLREVHALKRTRRPVGLMA